MAEVPLGKFIDETFQRDAVHVAIAPVQATEDMAPSDKIDLIFDSTYQVMLSDEPIGLVDPYLALITDVVKKGQWFYMVLLPNTVTGMRHHWSHTSFPGEDKAYSEKWLMAFATECGFTYNRLMDIIKEAIDNGSFTLDSNTAQYFNDQRQDLSTHYNAVTGSRLSFLEIEVEEDDEDYHCGC